MTRATEKILYYYYYVLSKLCKKSLETCRNTSLEKIDAVYYGATFTIRLSEYKFFIRHTAFLQIRV